MSDPQAQADPKQRLYQMAKEFDDVLAAMYAAGSAFHSFITMGNGNLTLAETIHYQTGALDLLDDIKTYLPVIQSAVPKLEKQLITVQEIATEAASDENER